MLKRRRADMLALFLSDGWPECDDLIILCSVFLCTHTLAHIYKSLCTHVHTHTYTYIYVLGLGNGADAYYTKSGLFHARGGDIPWPDWSGGAIAEYRYVFAATAAAVLLQTPLDLCGFRGRACAPWCAHTHAHRHKRVHTRTLIHTHTHTHTVHAHIHRRVRVLASYTRFSSVYPVPTLLSVASTSSYTYCR